MKKIITLITLIGIGATAFGAGQSIYLHAHRGEPKLAPQNTVESYKLAFELGARMIETDFHLTESGSMVCIHWRNELRDIWGIDKDVHKLTDAEIKSARLKHPEKFDKKYADCRLPLIDDVFAIIPKDKYFELEIKHYGDTFADKVEVARKKAGLDYNNMLITSFDGYVIKDFKKRYPKYETVLIMVMNNKKPQTAEEIIKNVKKFDASQVAIGNYWKLDRAFIKKIQDAGIKVSLWHVDNLNDLNFVTKLGADRICSNNAHQLKADFKRIKELDLQ